MQIEIPDSLLRRLQKHATPFVDTPVSVIERWGDFYEKRNGVSEPKVSTPASTPHHLTAPSQTLLSLSPDQPPSLLHTIVRGEFGTQHFSNWNDLLRMAHIEAFKKAGSFSKLRQESIAQIYEGHSTDRGYHFLPKIGISLQGVDADRAWRYALRLAKYLGTPVKAIVEWRYNEKSAKPGERGLLTWTP